MARPLAGRRGARRPLGASGPRPPGRLVCAWRPVHLVTRLPLPEPEERISAGINHVTRSASGSAVKLLSEGFFRQSHRNGSLRAQSVNRLWRGEPTRAGRAHAAVRGWLPGVAIEPRARERRGLSQRSLWIPLRSATEVDLPLGGQVLEGAWLTHLQRGTQFKVRSNQCVLYHNS